MIMGGYQAGAWVRDSGPPHRLTITAEGRSLAVTLGEDLGQLLQCCGRIVVRDGSVPLLVPAEALVRWRALQVVTGAPLPPFLERLKKIFPEAALDPAGFRTPTAGSSPEEILASCLAQGIPVMQSRIVYRPHPNSG
jgi:hypothetical protein